jgi:nucleotide-binding universal stress UspA family protein
MSSDLVIVVAVEDMATVGVVAAGAAQFAMEQGASRLILLHVLDDHALANGFSGLMGTPVPVVETREEASEILGYAEEIIAAEYGATERPLPVILRELGEGRAGPVIALAAADAQASAIVLGARRPHALGRLTHPDVVAYLRKHTATPVHVVSLQAETSPSTGSPVQ